METEIQYSGKTGEETMHKPSETDVKLEEELLKNSDNISSTPSDIDKLNLEKIQRESIPMDPPEIMKEKLLSEESIYRDKDIIVKVLRDINKNDNNSYIELRNIYKEKYIKSRHEKLISFAVKNDKDEIILRSRSIEGIELYKDFSLAIVDNKNKILAKIKSINELNTIKNALTYLMDDINIKTKQKNKEMQKWAKIVKKLDEKSNKDSK